MAVVRIQIGHYQRTRGNTGASNRELDVTEQGLNKALADQIAANALARPVAGVTFEFVGADEKKYGSPDIFIALHMDGADREGADGPSVGYPPSSASSQRFAQIWKNRRELLDGPSAFRADNYTTGLSRYYGYGTAWSGTAAVKMVLENGFTTNNADARWAMLNRSAVADSVIDSCAQYLSRSRADAAAPAASPAHAAPTVDDLLAVRRSVNQAWKLQGESRDSLKQARADLDALINPK